MTTILRHKVAKAALASLLAFSSTLSGSISAEIPFYVSASPYAGVGKGIYRGLLNTQSGQLSRLEQVASLRSPTFLAISSDCRRLYAAQAWSAGGDLAAFRIQEDGSLAQINRIRFRSGGAADHISIDATGRFLLAASWKGLITDFPIEPDGAIGDEISSYVFSGSGPAKYQDAAHCHSIYSDALGKFAYVCDLGSDVIGIFRIDSPEGALAPAKPFSRVPAGSGPRHLAFGGDRFVYVNNQMGRTVSVFSRDPLTGRLSLIQTTPTISEDVVAPPSTDTSEIAVHPSGKWLYVGNRRYNAITVFEIEAAGTLRWVGCCPVDLKDPVSFAIDSSGEWMVAAGQDDTRIVVLRIDVATGKLTATGQQAAVEGPSCIVFAESKPLAL